jgi:hypothetical protein
LAAYAGIAARPVAAASNDVMGTASAIGDAQPLAAASR